MSNTLTINLSAIKDTPIPDGVYHVTIADVRAGITGKNEPKVDVKIKILEGPEEGQAWEEGEDEGGDGSGVEGHKLTLRFYWWNGAEGCAVCASHARRLPSVSRAWDQTERV